MKAVFLLLILFAFAFEAEAQRKRPATTRKPQAPAASKPRDVGQIAVVMDERLSVLRDWPSLYANAIQRMRRGRKVQILGVAEADGVKFFRVSAPPASTGWVQADAVYGSFREGDEERLARLVQSMNGFEQIEAAVRFFEIYPRSRARPPLLLLFGDLIEDAAVRLSRDANSRLSRPEMAASGAPLHSYYLNFVSLDRYRRLGIKFLFNPRTRRYHYDGASWKEIVASFASAPETAEAQKRLDSLKEKMDLAEAN
jgi:hypothetical protein